MDRMSDSGSDDGGSNPFECTLKELVLKLELTLFFVIVSAFNLYFFSVMCEQVVFVH